MKKKMKKWHGTQERVQSRISLLMPGQTYRSVMSAWVARIPG